MEENVWMRGSMWYQTTTNQDIRTLMIQAPLSLRHSLPVSGELTMDMMKRSYYFGSKPFNIEQFSEIFEDFV